MLKKLPILIITIVLFSFPIFVNAQADQYYNTIVNAFVGIDAYSRLDLDPQSTEVGIESEVKVTIVDASSSPLENHSIQFYVDGPGVGVTFTQPPNTNHAGEAIGSVKSSNTGAFIIRALDTTYSEDISITDSETLYVFPVPTPELDPEPHYTKGNENTLYWDSVSGLSTYEYYIEVGLDESFNTVVANSGWVNTNQDVFEELLGAKMYYYRIRARNESNATSPWSALQYSIQDDTPPTIRFENIDFIIEDDVLSGIQIDFDVRDDLELRDVSFYCVRDNGDKELCGAYEQNGTSYTAIVPLEQLERTALYSLLDSYSFCVYATDEAGNVNIDCDMTIEIEEYIRSNDPFVNTVINTIIDWINTLLTDASNIFTGLFIHLQEVGLRIVTVSLLVLLLIISLGLIAGNILLIPNLITQTIFRIFSWLGWRKHGKRVGFVYDSVSKRPVYRAIVYIYDKNDSLVYKTVTDKQGLFYATLVTGKYRLVVKMHDYLFPSALVKGKSDDDIKFIYHGEFINISSKHPMNISIPLDPIDLYKDETHRAISHKRFVHFMKSLSILFFVIGLGVSIRLYEVYVSNLNLILLLMFVLVGLLFIRNLIHIKPKIEKKA